MPSEAKCHLPSKNRALLFSVAPRPDESFIGYLLRLTELNRYETLSWILQLAQIKSYVRSNLSFAFDNTLQLAPLSQLCGVDTAKLATLLYQSAGRPKRQMGDYHIANSTVPQYMIRLRYPKICPACLNESVYARKIWDLAPVTACPLHKCLLLDQCPGCMKRISWARCSVIKCRCGYDWREFRSSTVKDASELEVARRLQQLCSLSAPGTQPNRNLDTYPLDALDLKHFLSALFFVASQYAGLIDTKGKHLAPSMRNAELHVILCKAWSVFEHWPNSYFNFLDWRRTQVADSPALRGVRRDFGEYRSALYTQLAVPKLTFMRTGFEEYLIKHWDGGYAGQIKRLNNVAHHDRKYVSRRETKNLLKVGTQSIDKFIAIGRLKAIVRAQGRTRLILIERAAVLEFKHELDRSLYLKQVQGLLGLSHTRVLELVAYKLLNPLRGPLVDGCSDWRFSGREVNGLLERAKEKVKASKAEVGASTSFMMALRMLARVKVGMGQFVRAILEGEVVPCGESLDSGLNTLLFSKVDLSEYAFRQRCNQIGKTYNAPEAAKVLGVGKDVVYFLTRKGILGSRNSMGERYSDLLISQGGIDDFNSTYVLPAKIAAQLGTVSGHLTNLLTTRGIRPVSGPQVDGGRQNVFRKSDLDGVNIDELVAVRNHHTPGR